MYTCACADVSNDILDDTCEKNKSTYVSRGEHELCMLTAYDGAAKLDTIGRLVFVWDRGRRSTDADDGRARFDESEGLSGLVTRLWNDKHYPYEGIC